MNTTELFNDDNDFVSSSFRFVEDLDASVFNPDNFTDEGCDVRRGDFCIPFGKLVKEIGSSSFLLNKRVGIKDGEEGIFPLKFNGRDCTLFKWLAENKVCGMLVYNDDVVAYEKAKRLFRVKKTNY